MKINLKHVISRLTFLHIFLLFLTFQSQGQELISRESGDYPTGTEFLICSGGTCNEIILPPAIFNQNYVFPIPLLVSDPDVCLQNNKTCNIDHTFDVTNCTINFLASSWDPLGEENYIKFNLHVEKYIDPVNHIDNQVFRIPIRRDTAKIVLVLDVSGSMSRPVPLTGKTRLEELKAAVNNLAFKLQEFRLEGDSIGITYFTTSVIQPSITNFPKDFIEISDATSGITQTTIENDLTLRTPLSATAMGLGLLDAKKKLLKNKEQAPNTKRMVFLVTDGIQNRPPYARLDGVGLANDYFYYESYFRAGGSDVVDYLNEYSDNPKDSIKYFTVATWEAGTAPEVLNAIATNSGGEALHAIPNIDLENWFGEQINNMLHEGSPQTVLNKQAENLSETAYYTFNINALVKTLLIDVSSNDINVSFKKDETDMNPYVQNHAGADVNINCFHFPIITDTDTIYSEGKWEVTLNGNTSNPYYISVMVDDHYLNYRCELNKKIFTTGETIEFYTKISHLGTPITGEGNTVTAVVLKPSDDIGHLLSIYETSLCDTSDDDITESVSQKFAHLMATDITFYNALLPDEQTIVLNDLGNGEYTGSFSNTNISGPYNVIYLINGEIPELGKFDRSKMISSLVVSDGSVSDVNVFIDTEAPSTPANCSATNLTETSVRIKWDPSFDNFGIDKYIIYQNGVAFQEVNFNKCFFNIYNLAPGTYYSYYIVAKDASGIMSENSSNIDFTTPGEIDTEAPVAPTNLSVSNISQTSLHLNWNNSTDNVSVIAYDIYKNNEKLISTSLTDLYILNLLANTEYSFYVVAKDASGNISEISNTLNVQTLETPDTESPMAPTNLSALDITQTSLYLNWNIPNDNKGVTEYDIFENNVFLSSTNTNELFRANLAPNTSYSYYINAKDAAGNISENSSVINITTLGIVDTIAPATPTNLIASNIAQSSLYLSWNECTDNVGTILYQVYQNDDFLTSLTNTNYSVTNLISGTDYSFYVIAKDAANNVSDNSNIIDVSTLGLPDTELPTTPGNLAATNIGQYNIYLSWNESIDNTGVDKYIIYQNGNAISSTSAISKSIIGLSPNTTYSFYVVAEDLSNNTSDHSNEISVTTLKKSDVLSAPSRLTVSNITQTSFKLNWNASTGNIGEVEYGLFLDGSLIDKTSNTNYIVTGLSASNSYKVHLIAKDSRRNISNASKTVKVVTLDRFVLTPKDFYKIVGVKIRPESKFGYYMGPGFKSIIKFEYKPKKPRDPIAHKTSLNDESQERMVNNPEPYLKNIQDNLDGSYYLILGNVAPKTNPDIKITVRDNTLYEGPLYKIPLWFYIIIIITIVIILLLLIGKLKQTKFYKFMWIILIVLLVIWLLHYTGQLFFLYMM